MMSFGYFGVHVEILLLCYVKVSQDGPVTGVFGGRSGDGRSGDGRLRRALRRRASGDGFWRRAGVARSRLVNRDISKHESDTESELSEIGDRASSSLNAQHPTAQRARARGIDRTGTPDLAGKRRTCASYRSLRLCHRTAATGPERERAHRTTGFITRSTRTGGQRSTRINAEGGGIETDGRIGAKGKLRFDN